MYETEVQSCAGACRSGTGHVGEWDNPAIEGDEETGSPKFGYAVSFAVANTDQRAVIGSVTLGAV